VFAPLLFGTSAYLGFLASYLQRKEEASLPRRALQAGSTATRRPGWREEIETGQFQKHLCVVTAVGTLCSGGEAWYSHYKDNFKYRVQWSPILITPLLAGAARLSLPSRTVANTLLPVASAAAMLNGVIGTAYHVRGILRRDDWLGPMQQITIPPPPLPR
jgi:hypothetical protein